MQGKRFSTRFNNGAEIFLSIDYREASFAFPSFTRQVYHFLQIFSTNIKYHKISPKPRNLQESLQNNYEASDETLYKDKNSLNWQKRTSFFRPCVEHFICNSTVVASNICCCDKSLRKSLRYRCACMYIVVKSMYSEAYKYLYFSQYEKDEIDNIRRND